MNVRENKGITLSALVITVILLLIISGISITGAIRVKKETNDSTQIAELNIIQHALLERYSKSQLTKEELPGEDVDKSSVQTIVNDINSRTGGNITLKGTEYKKLSKSDLEELGVKKEENIFIVNYKTGEVINTSVKVTKGGAALYTFAKESEN